jgi:membrane protease YdiL (CAAX protease family)
MNKKALIAYFVILIILCASFVVGARMMGKNGAYLAQGYMLTPAMAAIITRIFFYPAHFKDANLRFGKLKDYFKFWIVALGITALSFIFYTLFGAIEWDLSASSFLDRLEEQFAVSGKDMLASLPSGFTPQTMLLLFTVGGLTVFNILPGLISGFGEEFGHRGFMFPELYRIKPWIGLVGGGLIWYAWHLPLSLIIPSEIELPLGTSVLNHIILGIGSVCAFTYLAYVYVKSGSVFVTSIAHIAMNNAAAALSYYVIVQNQTLANLGLTLTMIIVLAFLYLTGRLDVFKRLVAIHVEENVPQLDQINEPNPRL